MSSVLTAQPAIYMTPDETRNIAVSFVGKLTIGDLLTGTPTVSVSGGSNLAVNTPAVNSGTIKMEIPDNEHYAIAGQAVTFKAVGTSATVAVYTVKVTCSTTGGQVLQEYVTINVATS